MAQPLLDRYLDDCYYNEVTAVCRCKKPKREHPLLKVVDDPGSVVPWKLGEFDLLVTVTGGTSDKTLAKMDDVDWHKAVGPTLGAVATAFRQVKVKDGGNVVVVGSVVGSTGAYGAANYAAAKAGLVGLVRSAALEWASRGVCVNLLELGFVDAGMGARLPDKVKARVLPTIPLGRFGTEAEFVHAVEFLSTVRYMTGGVLTLAGGLR